jgi:hypothetical protein
LSNCGQNSESCCASNEILAVTFSRTYTNNGGGATGAGDHPFQGAT